MAKSVSVAKSSDSIWADDHLGRREDAAYMRTFIERRIEERGKLGQKKSYVLNLDAAWGQGKTFFLERFAQEATSEGHLVAYVNAWRDDFSDDPLVAVMSAIDTAVAPHIPKTGAIAKTYKAVKENFGGILLAGAKGFAGQVAKRAVGDVSDQIAAIVGDPTTENGEKSSTASALNQAGESTIQEISDRMAKKAMHEFAAARRSVALFKEGLETLLARLSTRDIPLPLYVLVDELDRCRPPFAIATLERVKHLFSADNVAFVVATDTEQLSHSIQAVYGADFASGTYLNRFFDRTYRFDAPAMLPFVRSLVSTRPIESERTFLFGQSVEKFLADTFSYFGVSLRDAEQAYDLIRTIATTWDYSVPIELGALVPLAVAQIRAIEPEMGSELIEALESQRPRGWKETPSIGFRLKYRNESYQTVEMHVTPHSLFQIYRGLCTTPLPQQSGQRSNGLGRLVQERFQHEFAMLHNNMHTPGREPLSLVSQYPGLVKKAGRMTVE